MLDWKATVILAMAVAAIWTWPLLAAVTYDFSYSGRLVDEKNGKPFDGPVALRVNFFHQATGGDPVLSVEDGLGAVPLQEGIFQITLNLSQADYHRVFAKIEQPVFVEITDVTHKKGFDRQQVSMIPYAAKVPVDDKTLTFTNDGRLTLATQSKPAANQFLTKDDQGNLVWGTPLATATGLQGREVASQTPTTGQVLAYDGTRWTPLSIAGSNISFNLATQTTGVLPVTNGGTNSSTALAGNRIMVSQGGAIREGDAMTNGQLLIGATGSAPVAATLTLGVNASVTITNGAGSITLDAAQDIRTSATPTFNGIDGGNGTIKGATHMTGTGDGTSEAAGGSLRSANKTGANATGSDLTIAAGNGTGSGGSGSILFQTAPGSGSSSMANTMTNRMAIDKTGNVGIGTITPLAKLYVDSGQIVSKQNYDNAAGVTSIDFNLGNVAILDNVSGSTITLNNMVDGGAYTIIIRDPISRTYSFSNCTNARYNPINGPTAAGTHSIYTIIKATISSATWCYISWMTEM